jgi:hypothetical protein
MSNNEEIAMTRTRFRTLLAASTSVLASPGALLAAEPKAAVGKPNIVYILAETAEKVPFSLKHDHVVACKGHRQ